MEPAINIVYVAGFFDPVKKALTKCLSEHLRSGAVVWIPQLSSGLLDLRMLKELLFSQVATGAHNIFGFGICVTR